MNYYKYQIGYNICIIQATFTANVGVGSKIIFLNINVSIYRGKNLKMKDTNRPITYYIASIIKNV